VATEAPVQNEYCRRDRRETRWTRSGGQNGDRPAVAYWRCSVCGRERVELGTGRTRVSDVEGLALSIVSERRRGIRPALAEGREMDAASEAEAVLARLDYDDATAQVTAGILSAYYEWDAERNPSLLSHVTWKGRCALSSWFRIALGRDTPRALTWALSLDGLSESDGDEEGEGRSATIGAVGALAEASIVHAIVLIEDEEISETLRDIVLPLAQGYSQGEVARMNGQTEGWVSSKLRKLRAREDLRVPA
jgi:hypothetical protein